MEEIAGMSSLTVRIAPEARKILDRVANSLVYDEKDRLPLESRAKEPWLTFEVV
jgi:hypothetical protein